jgi:hypothetical protein
MRKNNMINEKRTVIVKDVELHWAKLDAPVDPFKTGEKVWEVQIRTDDENVAKSWAKDYFINAKKDDEGHWKANIKRKELNRKGESNQPPVVLGRDNQPMPSSNIGNGSIGDLKLFQYPYDVAGRKGVSSMLSAVRVTNLKEYTPSSEVDFDVIEGAEGAEAQADF